MWLISNSGAVVLCTSEHIITKTSELCHTIADGVSHHWLCILCILPSNKRQRSHRYEICFYSRIFSHCHVSCMLNWTEVEIYSIYCSFKLELLTRGKRGVGTAAAWPQGKTLQLSPLQLLPLISLICHLKKKASRAATQTCLSRHTLHCVYVSKSIMKYITKCLYMTHNLYLCFELTQQD